MSSDDLDRDKLYAADAEDDDFEYELEPPDPDVLDVEKRRAAEVVESVKKSIDIDQIYRDIENRDTEVLDQWLARARGYRFQFQIKHLLILTAVVAVLLTLRHLGVNLITFVVVSGMLLIGGITLYLQWLEKKRLDEADRRRHKMYAERRAALNAGAHGTIKPVPPVDTLAPVETVEPVARPIYRFRFSLAQFMIAITCAALILGFVTMLGGPSNAATLCGFIALVGLVVHALGYEPPEVVAFVWWMILLMYVGLSITAAFWASLGG
jgi:hypothetical protein